MAKSSIHFAKASSGGTKHNDRTQFPEPDYLLPEKYRLENEVDFSAEEAEQKIKDLYATTKENYEKIKGQRLQATSYRWEAVINLNKNHTLEDVQRLTKAIEKETGFTSVQIAIHRDEGHIENDTPIYNLHAHITFFTLDKDTGEQLYRKAIKASDRRKIENEILEQNPSISKGEPKSRERKAFNKLVDEAIKEKGLKVFDKERLSKLQDLTAEVLQMERGKKGSTAQRLEHKQLRAVKQAEQKQLAKVKDLTALNNKLREQLKQADLDRETKKAKFRELEQLNRELKQQIKNKDLTITELQEKLKAPQITDKKEIEIPKQPKLKRTKKEVVTKESLLKKETETQEFYTIESGQKLKESYKQIKNKLIEARETILKQKATIYTQKELIERLRANISDLEHKVRELENELKGYRGKDRQSKRRDVATARKSLKSAESELSSLISTERSEIEAEEIELSIMQLAGLEEPKPEQGKPIEPELLEKYPELFIYRTMENLKEQVPELWQETQNPHFKNMYEIKRASILSKNESENTQENSYDNDDFPAL